MASDRGQIMTGELCYVNRNTAIMALVDVLYPIRYNNTANDGFDMARTRKKAGAKAKFKRFEASDFLKSEAAIEEFLATAIEDSNPDVFLAALSEVAKARGIAALAEHSGLGRESLYKTLAPGAKPRYETICKLVDALGIKLTVKTA